MKFIYRLLVPTLILVFTSTIHAQTISISDSTLCYGDSAIVTLDTIDSNYTAYQWQVKTQSGNWTDLSNGYHYLNVDSASLIILNASDSLDSNFYRVLIDTNSDISTFELTSGSLGFLVYAQFSIGNIIVTGTGTNPTLCNNTGTIIKIDSVQGGDSNYTYTWTNLTNNYTLGGSYDTLHTRKLQDTKTFKVLVSDTGCNVSNSKTHQVNVYAPLSANSISGPTDSICYNSATTLSISNVQGEDNSYNYTWKNVSNNNTVGGNADTLNTGPLTGTTTFKVTIANQHCGTSIDKQYTVNVYPAITMNNITASDDTLCDGENTTLTAGNTSGGGGPATKYYWYSKSITGAYSITDSTNNDSITLTNQTDSKYYKYTIKTNKGCITNSFSNAQYIHVYDPFSIGNISVTGTNPPLCNNTGTIIKINSVQGGDGSYTYTWTNLTNNYTLGGSYDTLNTRKLQATKTFKVLVSDTGCNVNDSITYQVNVYNKTTLDKILPKDTAICHGNSITLKDSLISGNAPNPSYQWWDSTSTSNFSKIQNDTNTTYTNTSLTSTTYYYLEFKNTCDTVSSDTIMITVNPLPDNKPVSTDFQTVCKNQFDAIYKVDTVHGRSYLWHIKGGSFMGGQNTNQVVVHWGNATGDDSLFVTTTDTSKITKCAIDTFIVVTIGANSSPNKTRITQKANSNILVCQDASAGIHYQWGYTNRNDSLETLKASDTLQYNLFPHLDTANYRYWVETYFGQACSTKSYFNPGSLPISIDENPSELNQIIAYPIPTNGRLTIKSTGVDLTDAEYTLYDIQGKLYSVYSNNKGNLIFQENLSSGLYILRIIVEDKVFNLKIMVSK